MIKVLVDGLSATLGGGLSYLTRQVRAMDALNRADITVAVPASRSHFVSAHLVGTKVALLRLPVSRRFSRHLAGQSLGLARRHDVLHAVGNHAPLVASIPRVLTIQNPNYFGRGRTLAHNQRLLRKLEIRMSHHAVDKADAVIAISDYIRDAVLSDCPEAVGKVHVIKSGDPTWPSPHLADTEVALPEKYFLSLANAYPHKRLPLLVEAWSRFAAGHAEDAASLVLVGDVPKDSVRAMSTIARKHGVSPPIFLGAIADRDVLRVVVSRAHAMVSASVLEAYPLTPAEAGALGVPVVLSDIEPHREVTQGRGIFFRPDDLHALERALVRADARTGDAAPWNLGYSWRDHSSAVLDVLESVC